MAKDSAAALGTFLQDIRRSGARIDRHHCCSLGGVGGIIVETEAYDASDPASHSFRKPTPRSAPMFGPNGHAYVYRISGLHGCLNFTCGEPGGAFLIRALEALYEIENEYAARQRRSASTLRWSGRLAKALGIDGALNCASLFRAPFMLMDRKEEPSIGAGSRIGIRVAIKTPWRFANASSRFLSRPI